MKREIEVNVRAGQTNAWLHSDEIFGFKHGNMFEPNEEAISEVFSAAASITPGSGLF